MKSKHSRWITVVGGVTIFLLLATMVSASRLPSPAAAPLQATGDADTVDGHHAAYSGATSNSARANNVLWATSGGKLHWRSLPLWNLDKRYVNGDRAETIVAASSSPILNVHNTGSGPALQTQGAGTNGLYVVGATQSGIRVQSAGWDGIEVDSAGWSGIWVQSSGYDAIRVQTAGQDGLRFFDAMGRDYIRAGSDADLDFRVLNTGEVRSDVGYYTLASDFAEQMGFEGLESEYEPGDVLVVSDRQDRSVQLSSSPYSKAVIGVYSANPGFVGGTAVGDEDREAGISVALVGIVPCKVSAENGAISRGDLLVTSSTPGHAMRADNPAPGTILGKALEPLETGTGVIQVLVTLQ
jgi:hypothetical protein